MRVSTINWSTPLKVDKQFAYLTTVGIEAGQYFENDNSSEIMRESYWKDGKVFHPEYKILFESVADYVATRGRFLLLNEWKPEQDEDVGYFEANFEQAPFALKNLMTDIKFDWSTRIFSRVIDLSLRTNDIWIDANMDWSFGGELMQKVEILDADSKLVSITDRDKRVWKNKTIKMDQLQTIEYIKPTDVSAAYVIVLGGQAKINGNEVPEDFIGSIASSQITIENVNSPVILLREKHDII